MAPRKKKEVDLSDAAKLLKTLEFCAAAQRDQGMPYQSHILLANKSALAFDGVLAVGTGIEFGEIRAAPHTEKLIAALKKCKTQYSITQLESGNIVVKSGAFRAIVPCLPVEDLATSNVRPDDPVAVVSDILKKGFAVLNPMIKEATQHVVTSSLLLQANTMVATDRVLFAEFWHGINLPPGLVIPKAALAPVIKAQAPLVRLGFSQNSVTFWFEDYSWIKTQCHSEAWPNTGHIFNFKPKAVELPKKLKEAVDAVSAFTEDGCVYLNQDEVASHLDNAIGASYDCKGVPGGAILKLSRLIDVLEFATHVDWETSSLGVYFAGAQTRAMLSKRLG